MRSYRSWGARPLLFALASLGQLGCRGSEQRKLESEVSALGHSIDALRDAPNEAKAPLLAELERAPCDAAAACDLKAVCVEAYRTHLRGLDASSKARSLLATPDGGALASLEAAQEITRAEAELTRAAEQTERCASAQGALRRKSRERGE